MLGSLLEVTVFVRDWQRSRSFYEEVLECRILRLDTVSREFSLGSEGARITFRQAIRDASGPILITFSVPDVAHFCRRVRLAGGRLEEESVATAALQDPDGNRICVLAAF
jgi:catechol 2,3-dioxygenase-like lactoylglutathione lyase family enzyme